MGNIAKTGMGFVFDLYKATLTAEFQAVTLPPGLIPYAERLYTMYKQNVGLLDDKGELVTTNPQSIDVGLFSFSGGKDSLAVFLKHRHRYSGTICCYVAGASPAYIGEHSRAQDVATRLGVSLRTIQLRRGKNGFLQESVIKNQLIHAMMLDEFGLPQGIGFGATEMVGLQSMAFFHDSKQAFELFHRFAEIAWGDHEFAPFLEDEVDSYNTIFQTGHEDLLNFTASCMTRPHLKRSLRLDVENRFGQVSYNDYDCCACYKCAEKAFILNRYFDREYVGDYLDFCKDLILEKARSPHKMNGFPAQCLGKLGLVV